MRKNIIGKLSLIFSLIILILLLSFVKSASADITDQKNGEIEITTTLNSVIMSEEEEINVNSKSNLLPNINATLVSDEILNLSKGDEFTVRYKLYPENFQFTGGSTSSMKDVVILVDNSKHMDGNALNGTMNSIMNNIVDNEKFKNSDMRYSIITLANDGRGILDLTSDRSKIQPLTSNIQSGGPTSGSEAYLGSALSNIFDVFERSGRAEASKNVIIVAQENINYDDEQLSDFKKRVKENGYNVIALIAGQKYSDNNLNKMSNLVGANGLNLSNENVFSSGNDHNSIANSIMTKIADRLINSVVYKSYIFNPEITIDLLENFEVRGGLAITNGNVAKVTSDTKIVYNHIGNNVYHAKPIEIEFIVAVKTNKSGELNFGNAKLIHKTVNESDKTVILKTPKVIVKTPVKDLVHGLYSGIIDNELVIEKSSDENGFMLSAGSMVTFAAGFKGSGSEFDLNLSLNDNIDVKNEEIKVYKLVNNGDKKQLLELSGKITSLEENLISINAINSDNTNVETEFVVIYKGKIKNESINSDFINKITISDLEAEVKVYTPNIENSNENYLDILPELF